MEKESRLSSMLLYIFEHNVLSFPQIMGHGLLRVPAFRFVKQLVKHYDKHILMISSQQNKKILRVYGSAVALSVLEESIALLHKKIL
jgi:hypothetical protein